MAKVRVKATGKIMDFAPQSVFVVQSPNSPNEQEYEYYRINSVEIIPDDYNSFRNEFAKAAMQSLLLHGNNSDEWIARRSFEIADEMIKQSEKYDNDKQSKSANQ